MKKAIIMLACMLATALQAQNTTCDTVRNLPWSDGFDSDIACWTVPSGSNWMFFDPSAGGALLNSYIQSNSQPVGTDNWIVSRPIALPAVDSMNLVLEWGDGNYDDEDYPYRYSVLVTTSADLTGRREQVRLTPDGPGQYSLDLTSRPQATYLLTLTTASGKTHTVRLLKQSDIFSR